LKLNAVDNVLYKFCVIFGITVNNIDAVIIHLLHPLLPLVCTKLNMWAKKSNGRTMVEIN